jgi:phenylacetate-CoA ligase
MTPYAGNPGRERDGIAFARLQHAIERVWRTSAFHRDHWLGHGVTEGWVPESPDALRTLPYVHKEDLLAAQQAAPPWGGNLCVDPTDIAQVHLTSGTSGIGQERYAVTAGDVEIMGRSWHDQYEAIGLERGDVAVFTIPISFMCAGLSALEGARMHRLVPLVTGVASKDMIIDLIGEHRAAYLYGTESFLLQLAGSVRARGLEGAWGEHLKGVQSVGTSPQLIAVAREVFDAPLFEVYGCTQAAAKIATACRLGVDGGVVHFHDEHLHIELVDVESGAPVESGPAAVVISTVFRHANPVIRFNLRDQVELVPAGSCECGDPRPGYRPGSVARTDSMLKIRGMNVWPSVVERIVLAHPEVREFRATAEARADGADDLVLRIATAAAGEAEAALIGDIEESVRAAILVRPTVVIDRDIPDAHGVYKPARWADERKRQRGG